MRLGILVLLLIATLFGSGFWYNHIDITCRAPIHYRIGTIDERFGTSEEEVHRIALRAEALWEDALRKELFVYDPEATLPINFVFDERQEASNAEEELREDITAKEGMSESVSAQYEKLIAEFRLIKKQYEARVVSYENSLKSYNAEVTKWNSEGGAPEPVLEELKEDEAELKAEQEELNELTKKLNSLVVELNRIGARGNALIKDYNTIVDEYNARFSESYEFTQGDYAGKQINIYQFDSETELVVVLAHEFGHALSLEHVTNDMSIMYHVMGEQDLDVGITPEDRVEFERVCKDVGVLTRVLRFFASFV